MGSLVQFTFVFLAVVAAVRTESFPSQEKINKLSFEGRITEALDFINRNATLKAAYEQHLEKYEELNPPLLKTGEDIKFPCDLKRSDVKPTSVHKLQPGDIDVVAAMGDSITGGNGVEAKNFIGILTQWRGDSWSIGGDQTWRERPTVPNFLRTVNPNITGYSLGTGNKENPNAHLNVAKAGAKANNIPIQARMLVDRLKTEPGVDFENDWKLITLFIGGNDICYCDLSVHNPETYKRDIMAGLDILHAEVPKAFVNLVEVLDISVLSDLNSGIVCTTLHVFLCPCGAFPLTKADKKNMEIISQAFQATIAEIVATGRYDTTDDFTVVHQPFFRHTAPPRLQNDKYDLSYFAPDCFHFSEKGHAAAAEALWNNMIEPIGMKRTDWRVGEPLECPTADYPYLATSKNGGGKTLKSNPNLLGAGAPEAKSSLPGVQINVNIVEDVEPTYHNQQAGAASPSSGMSVTSAVILACTLTLFVVLALAFVARTIAARGQRRYQRVPETDMIVTSTPPKYTL